MKSVNLRKIVFSAMLAAVITVATMIVRIPSPTGGYVNLGDCFVLISGWLLGPLYGFLVGGIGSGLADLLAGYPIYIAPTFIIKGLMSVCSWGVFRLLGGKNKVNSIIARAVSAVCAEIIMVAGYFIAEAIMFGVAKSALGVVGNVVQGVAGAVAGVILISIIRKSNLDKIIA